MKLTRILILILLFVLIAGTGTYFIFFYSSEQTSDFEIGSSLLKTVIRGGGESAFKVKIENLKDYSREFNIFFTNLDNLAYLDTEQVSLEPKETKFINVTFSNKADADEGVHIGFLNILSEDSSRRLPIILEVESSDVLFDGNIEVFPTTVKNPGTRISVEIKIFDLAFLGPSNVELTYFIKNFENQIIVSEEETIVVENQISITKPITLPVTLQEGNYIAGVLFKYKNSFGSATTLFSVGNGDDAGGSFFDALDERFLMLAVIAVFVIFAIVFLIYQRLKAKDILETQKRELRRIAGEIKKNKFLPKKSMPKRRDGLRKDLEQKLESLEKAKSSGYIGNEAYTKGKGRILRLMKKL